MTGKVFSDGMTGDLPHILSANRFHLKSLRPLTFRETTRIHKINSKISMKLFNYNYCFI